jgi:hypothetical protein
MGDSQLEDAVGDQPSAAGSAPVEAEHENVEIGLERRGFHRSLVGGLQPPLGEGSDPAHAGE